VQFFSADMNELTLDRQKLEARLWQAVEGGKLDIAYQPKLDIASGKVCGAERWCAGATASWARWRRRASSHSPRRPADREARAVRAPARRGATARVAGARPRTERAVNLSVRQFNDQLVSDIAATLKGGRGSPPPRARVTESIFLGGLEDSERIVRALTDLGLRFTIDDFAPATRRSAT